MRIQLSIVVGTLIVLGALGVTAFNVRGTAATVMPSVYLPFVANQIPGASVSLVDYAFVPTPLHVSVGTTVIWTNTTNNTPLPTIHTVTSDTLLFNSSYLNPGATFSFVFTTSGTYVYHCQIHGAPGGIGMSGSIVVSP